MLIIPQKKELSSSPLARFFARANLTKSKIKMLLHLIIPMIFVAALQTISFKCSA
jgi:hypothetical protein